MELVAGSGLDAGDDALDKEATESRHRLSAGREEAHHLRRRRQHVLADGDVGEHPIDHVVSRVVHPPRPATRTEPALLARERQCPLGAAVGRPIHGRRPELRLEVRDARSDCPFLLSTPPTRPILGVGTINEIVAPVLFRRTLLASGERGRRLVAPREAAAPAVGPEQLSVRATSVLTSP